MDAGERLDLEGIVVTEVGRNGHKVAWLQKPFGPGQLEELIQVALKLLLSVTPLALRAEVRRGQAHPGW